MAPGRAMVVSVSGLYGFLSSVIVGAGILLLPILMGFGLAGPALLATDAAISVLVNIAKVIFFGKLDALSVELFLLALEPLRHEGVYDFAHSDMARRMSALAEEVSEYRDFWRAPPTDAMYFHRKLGGMFLLASRVKARVDVNQLIKRFIS